MSIYKNKTFAALCTSVVFLVACGGNSPEGGKAPLPAAKSTAFDDLEKTMNRISKKVSGETCEFVSNGSRCDVGEMMFLMGSRSGEKVGSFEIRMRGRGGEYDAAGTAALSIFDIDFDDIAEDVSLSQWQTQHLRYGPYHLSIQPFGAGVKYYLTLLDGMSEKDLEYFFATDYMRDSLTCPAALTPLPEDAPAIDILGVYPGLPFNEAANGLLCHNSRFDLETDGSFFSDRNPTEIEPREVAEFMDFRECGFQSSLDAPCTEPPSREHVRLALTGFEGEEIVRAIWRTKTYAEGQQPPVANVLEQLKLKYGEPTVQRTSGSRQYMNWAYDLRGRLLNSSRRSNIDCARNLNADLDGTSRWNADCGQTIAVSIDTASANDQLVEDLHIASFNQEKLYRSRETFLEEMIARDKLRKEEEAGASPAADVDL